MGIVTGPSRPLPTCDLDGTWNLSLGCARVLASPLEDGARVPPRAAPFDREPSIEKVGTTMATHQFAHKYKRDRITGATVYQGSECINTGCRDRAVFPALSPKGR